MTESKKTDICQTFSYLYRLA